MYTLFWRFDHFNFWCFKCFFVSNDSWHITGTVDHIFAKNSAFFGSKKPPKRVCLVALYVYGPRCTTFDMTLEASTHPTMPKPTAPPMEKPVVQRPASLDLLRPGERWNQPHLRLQLWVGYRNFCWTCRKHLKKDISEDLGEWLDSLNGEEQGMCLRCYCNCKTIPVQCRIRWTYI